MSTTNGYGSITIVDITDLGEFSVYPMSNLPLTVVSDPNNSSYTPNWANNNLTITPVCYYAGAAVTPTSVRWTVQKNALTAQNISSSDGESTTSNNLKVTQNRFANDSTITMLTYYCTATYTEPETSQTLTAQGQITFSLIKHATNVKTCKITGDNVFKYNTNGVLTPTGATITLNSSVSNCSISKWQYRKSDGTYANYPSQSPNTNTGSTILVSPSDNVFVNDIATIKLTTNDNNVFDIFGITKLRDGAPGTDTVSAVLSNEDQMIPCDSSGTPTSYAGAETIIYIYDGGVDDTSNWTITTTLTNVSGSWDSTNHKYTVTKITADAGSVTFTCAREGKANIVKIFNLIKMKTGADGTSPTIYTIEPSTLAINKNISNVYTPETVTFEAYSQTGSASRNSYSGRFKIYINGNDTASYTSSTNESSYSYTPSGSDIHTIRCELYVAGGGGDPVDTQTVIITSDGATGNNGTDATNVIVGNESMTVACTAEKVTTGDSTITIPFAGYIGANRAACSVTYSTLPTGVTLSKNEATTDADGSLVFSVTSGINLGGTEAKYDNVTITLTFTCNNKTFIKYFTITKSITGASGVSATSVMLCNESASITCTSSRITTAASTITIPFTGYIGTSKAACTIAVDGNLPRGITTGTDGTNTAGTTSANGSLILNIANGADFGGTTTAYDNVTINLILTCNGQSFNKVFSISKTITGTSATNVVVGNYADVIPCQSNGKSNDFTITIPFQGYQGASKKYTKASITSGTIYGSDSSTTITPTITAATSNASGSIAYSISANSIIGDNVNTMSGEITIAFTVTNGTTSEGSNALATITQKYTWTKSVAATNSVLLDIYSPNGNIIQNGVSNVQLVARLINGASEQTSDVTYRWYQYKSSSAAADKYDVISGQTSATLNVDADWIDGYGSFKCVANYNSTSYAAYYSVLDKTDPLQVYIISTVGEQILNGTGAGVVYAKVYQNGTEIDVMPPIVQSTSDSSLSSSTKCYLIDTTNKTVTYKTRTSTSTSTWSTGTPSWDCIYVWSFRDKNGSTTNYNGSTTINSKILYVDSSLINKKTIFDVQVTKS